MTGYLTRNIESLAGCVVLASDENDPAGELGFREVEEVFRRVAFHLQVVKIRSSTGVAQTIRTTAEHPVYVLGRGWMTSAKLAAGDRLREPGGGVSEIVSSVRERHPEGIAASQGGALVPVRSMKRGDSAGWLDLRTGVAGWGPVRRPNCRRGQRRHFSVFWADPVGTGHGGGGWQ